MERIGRYELLDVLGRGGMGVVYRARDTVLGREVALKLLLDLSDPEERARFVREAQAAAAVSHPALLALHDVGEDKRRPYLVTELAAGSLADELRRGPLAPERAASLVAQIARGLAVAHAAGILHRDIKPANVLLGRDGRPLLGDFGLARQLQAETLTATGTVLGTPSYMAPEQARGERASDLSDVYGLGALLYACLTGSPPFRGASTLLTLASVLSDPPRPPRELVPEVPGPLSAICLRALAKEPRERPAGALALAEALEAWPSSQASPPSAGPRSWAGLLALTLGAALLAVAAWQTVLGGPAPASLPPPAPPSASPSRPRPQVDAPPSLLPEDDMELLGRSRPSEAQLTELRERVLAQVAAQPDLARPQLDLARIELALAQREPAQAAAERAMQLDPEDGGPYRLRAMILGRAPSRDLAALERDLATALRLAPQDWQALRERGLLRQAQSDGPGARADFARSIALRPSAAVWRSLGLLDFQLGQHGQAELAFTQALALEPIDLDSLRNLVQLARLRKDWATAKRFQARELELLPNDLDAIEGMLTLHIALQEYQAAIQLAERAERLGERPGPPSQRARALLELQRADEAAAANAIALERAPGDAGSWVLEVRIQQAREDWARLARACERYFALPAEARAPIGAETEEKLTALHGYASGRVSGGLR